LNINNSRAPDLSCELVGIALEKHPLIVAIRFVCLLARFLCAGLKLTIEFEMYLVMRR